MAANPKTNTTYVASFHDNRVSVISGQTNTVTATIPVGSFPARIAVNPKTSTAYVTQGSGTLYASRSSVPLMAIWPDSRAVATVSSIKRDSTGWLSATGD